MTTASSKLNLCFLGCGLMAKRHSKVAHRHSSKVVSSFASRSAERARDFARAHKGVASFGSYEEACAAAEVDAVFICTPPHLHLELVQLAAENGKSIVIEKPVARSLDELREMISIVDGAGVKCMVAENYHFKPSLVVLRQWLEEEAIGQPLFVEVNHAARSRPAGWRQDAQIMGGGALLEGGVHWVRALTMLGGPASAVAAVRPVAEYEPMAPFEDSIMLLLRFESRVAGKLLHSWAVPNPLKVIEFSRILGTEGTIHFESNGIGLALNGRRRALRVPSLLDLLGFKAMFAALVPYLHDGGASPLSLRDVYHDYAIVEAAYRSVESEAFETVESE